MTDPTPLAQLRVLREFKAHMTRARNESPFHARVVTDATPGTDADVPALHAAAREHVAHALARVRESGQSELILLSGEPGAGKSHLIRHFRRPEVADRCGYLFVGGPNHWSIDEFHPHLLAGLTAALLGDGPDGSHPLLDRVQAIAFRAVDQLRENRAQFARCLAPPAGGWLGRFTRLGSRVSTLDEADRLATDRDPAIFARLDFTPFGRFVCDRFLAERGNLAHRYALRVLLTYLFPEPGDAGVGHRERVLHWFAGRDDDGYFTRRLGVADRPVRRYELAEAVKLLAHLFSPEVSKALGRDDAPCRPLTFLVVFDQAEGRDELFDKDEDWDTFFGYLSELYNALPNLLVLFTMTLGLRDRLRGRMERQFHDRIRQDERFVLRHPSTADAADLYRARLDAWTSGTPGLRTAYRELTDPFLPFGRDRLLTIAGNQSTRDTLHSFDLAFTDHLRTEVRSVDPEYDFLFRLQDESTTAVLGGEHEYTATHLDTVRQLLDHAADWLLAGPTSHLTRASVEREDGPPVLRLDFVSPADPSTWVVVYLARFGHQFNAHVRTCDDLLHQRQRARYSVWMVRAREFTADLGRDGQMFARPAPPESEARLRAVVHLLRDRPRYEEMGVWPAVQAIVRREVDACYLGELFRHARERVAALAEAQPAADDPAVAPTT